MNIRLAPGDIAPDFDLYDQYGKNFSSFSYHGIPTIIYFYPRALTPGCTTQACDFQENSTIFAHHNIHVLGISPDPIDKLAEFAEKNSLTFPLLSNEDLSTIKSYGAYGEKNMYGKKTFGVIRSTILVNADWRVEHALYNVKATGHVAKLIKDWKL